MMNISQFFLLHKSETMRRRSKPEYQFKHVHTQFHNNYLHYTLTMQTSVVISAVIILFVVSVGTGLQDIKYDVEREEFVHPVILVPGNGGSQLEARLNKSSSGHWWCSKNSDW